MTSDEHPPTVTIYTNGVQILTECIGQTLSSTMMSKTIEDVHNGDNLEKSQEKFP